MYKCQKGMQVRTGWRVSASGYRFRVKGLIVLAVSAFYPPPNLWKITVTKLVTSHNPKP